MYVLGCLETHAEAAARLLFALRAGLAPQLCEQSPVEVEALIGRSELPPADAGAALRLLEGLRIVDGVALGCGARELRPGGNWHDFLRFSGPAMAFEFPFAAYLAGDAGDGVSLVPLADGLRRRWNLRSRVMRRIADGAMLMPLMRAACDHLRWPSEDRAVLEIQEQGVRRELRGLLSWLGWIEDAAGDGGAELSLRQPGRFAFQSLFASYVARVEAPGPQRRTGQTAAEASLHEGAEADAWDCIGDYRGESWFVDPLSPLDDRIAEILASPSPPACIAVVGDQDGHVARRLRMVIAESGSREASPSVVSVVRRAGRAAAGLERGLTVEVDALEPEVIMQRLTYATALEVDRILPVCAFWDLGGPSMAADELARWAAAVGACGLAFCSACAIDPVTPAGDADWFAAALCLDTHHTLAGRQPITAEQFVMAAARAGLFPDSTSLCRIPSSHRGTSMMVGVLERRSCRVRTASPEDLDALACLEAECWPEPLQVPVHGLMRRLRRFPDGQMVLESGGEVAGALFSQRISSASSLKGENQWTVERLHVAEGPVVQLLAVNVARRHQQRRLGDLLLELALLRAELSCTVERVVGVTRCRDRGRHRSGAYEQYIRRQGPAEQPLDSTLAFHALHGADIVEAVPGYRPGDQENEGHGVLVRYDPVNRRQRLKDLRGRAPSVTGASSATPSEAEALIVGGVAQALGVSELTADDRQRPLMELGLDSTTLMQIAENVRATLGLALESDFFFHHATIESASHAIAGLGGGCTSTKAVADRRPPPPQQEQEPVAIVGIACRLPGGINDQRRLWEHLVAGRSTVGQIPEGRLRWPEDVDPRGADAGIDQGGYLSDIARFDSFFFRMSPLEARYVDPQQRMLLELCWHCLEDAGISAESIRNSSTGVFVGVSGSDYQLLLNEAKATIKPAWPLLTSPAVMANRISYFFDLHGPSVAIDTACSSSLVAVHQALRSVGKGECNQALVGGVNVICHPANAVSYFRAGMLSASGRCRTFDAEADGYVRAEGGVVLLLKRLGDAERDGDVVYAIIKGSAVNHGGESSGLTVPNPRMQAEVIRSAMRDANVEPVTIGYVEAHGTGTPLGDPIEVSGLADAFGNGAGKTAWCGLGSVKTNLGHLEAAAGLAGLVKAALCIHYGELPPTINLKRVNARLKLDETPFYLVRRHTPWPPGGIRRAGISSFGSGGTNAHVVIEQAVSTAKAAGDQRDEGAPALICLSGRSKEALRRRHSDLLAWLGRVEDRELPAISATLLLRRAHFKHRAAYVVDDVASLRRALQCALDAPEIDGGLVQSGGSGRRRVLRELAAVYVQGENPDWQRRLFGGRAPLRAELPYYPFDANLYWYDQARR